LTTRRRASATRRRSLSMTSRGKKLMRRTSATRRRGMMDVVTEGEDYDKKEVEWNINGMIGKRDG